MDKYFIQSFEAIYCLSYLNWPTMIYVVFLAIFFRSLYEQNYLLSEVQNYPLSVRVAFRSGEPCSEPHHFW